MRRFNVIEWIGFILLAGLAYYLIYLLRSGQIISFIHPKRVPIMWASVATLLLLVAYQASKIFTIPNRVKGVKNYLSLAFILVCSLFTLSAKETDRFNTTQTIQNISINPPTSPNYEQIEDVNTYINEWAQKQEQEIDLPDSITITAENYVTMLSDIEHNAQRYVGKKIILEGFIYRDPAFATDEFVLARMYMICCAADVQVTGLMCKGNQSQTLADDQWVKVEGVLQVQNYEMYGEQSLMPVIQIAQIEVLATPDNQYIYY